MQSQEKEKTSEYLGIRYRILRSMRRTIQLSMGEDGILLIRMPFLSSEPEAEELISRHLKWIRKRAVLAEKNSKTGELLPKLTDAEMRKLKAEARRIIPERCDRYATLLGVDYNRISYRFQHTRWGSCTKNGSLSFNCLLVLAPEEVLDSVVVHELCHRKEMNHSARFYREIESVFPQYKKSHEWLKKHGDELIKRLP